ncbi:MAG: glycosyltransferase [Pseudomonadota bacterium]
MNKTHTIAVLLPCYNEESTIADVVKSFKKAVPDASIYVYDNNSTDFTFQVAESAGAIVRKEPLQGKGNVVRRMFADIDADIYLLADGDGTYDAEQAPILINELVRNNLDMVSCSRNKTEVDDAFRVGHQFGNRLFTTLVARLFGNRFKDILTGYRVFSRRFVKSFPALSRGFEIETELAIHALELRMPVLEIEAPYNARPAGSESKLKTFRDGIRILAAIILLLKEVRPLFFFGIFFVVFTAMSFGLAWPIIITYLETGLVPRFPTAILCTGLMLLAFINLTIGIILDSVTRGRREMKRMHYLNICSFGVFG